METAQTIQEIGMNATAVGALMSEHRMIERMIDVLDKAADASERGVGIPPALLEAAVSFFKIYADLRHHGKEESIFYSALSRKQLTPDDEEMLREMMTEHAAGRQFVSMLVTSVEKYAAKGEDAFPDVRRAVRVLSDFYRAHIDKEDRFFFILAMNYFSGEENSHMLDEFAKFDSYLPKDDYRKIISDFGG